VILALKSLSKDKNTELAIHRGEKWLLSMQNDDGSWSAFDKNNNHRIIEWYLKLRNYNIGKGPGLVLDRGSPDLTAHVLEALADHAYNKQSKAIQRAVKWLKKAQDKDGSWFGRWGLCYIYGTSAVLEALGKLGVNQDEPYIQKAIHFLEEHQNPDGGFGEVPDAYYDPAFKAKGPSTLTQTSWALLALIKIGRVNSICVKKGIAFLNQRIREDQHKDELLFQAVAAPPMYQRYELYPIYFPLMALHLFKQEAHLPGFWT